MDQYIISNPRSEATHINKYNLQQACCIYQIKKKLTWTLYQYDGDSISLLYPCFLPFLKERN